MDTNTATVNFTHAAEVATWTIWSLSTVLFAMRLFSRFWLKRNSTNLDDFIIVASWILAICRQAFYQRALTLIRQIDDNNIPNTVPPAAFWLEFSDYWFFLSSPPPKLAIGIVLVNIFDPRRWLRWVIIGSPIFLGILGIAGFFLNMFGCSPPAAQWDPYHYPHSSCLSSAATTAYTVVFAILGGVIDVAFSIYPAFVLWNLNIALWKKLSTAGFMSVGLVSAALCFVKLKWLFPLVGNTDPYRKLNYGNILGLFCCLENDLVVAAACLPYTRPIFHACRLRLKKHFKASGFQSSMDSRAIKSLVEQT